VSSLISKQKKVSSSSSSLSSPSSSKSDGGAMVELSSVQQELERITSEKISLEARVTELAPYQNEVMALRCEVQKLKVC
jgi:hypothetical protein